MKASPTILISRCYATTTPDSVEAGDFEDTGSVYHNNEFSFRDLVQEMRDFTEASCSPNNGDVRTWLSTGFQVESYSTGEEREETLHFSRDNPAKLEKYWRKAQIAAGILKN